MANPKKKTTHRRKNNRFSRAKLELGSLVRCPHCNELIKPHHVCPKCGYYDGKPIIAKKKKEKAKAK